MTTSTRKGVFISYSSSDREWLLLLKEHLVLYVTENQFSAWDDTQIKAGAKWFDEIQQALATAKVAVLLVSKKFLVSEFIGKHEVPVIREAFQSGGMEIIWIAIGFSGWEQTWLEEHQAAHNPREPLEKLSSWERDKILVDICEKIHQAVSNGAGETQLPQSGGMRTRYEIIRCNRTRYLNRYAVFLNAALKDRPGLPQACLVFGKFGQSHDTLVERMHREVIKPLADRETSASSWQGVLHKKNDVRWPEPADSFDRQQEDLQIELSSEYTGEIPSNNPPTFSASTFAGLPQFSNYRFITVRHTIDLSADSANDWHTLLTWYLQSYWAEVAKILEEKKAGQNWPQFLIFIKVRYETPSFLGKILNPNAGKFDKEVVKNSLSKIAKDTNMLFPCMLLDELLTPPYPEVVRWYTDNDIYNTEQDRFEAAINLYKQAGDQISMAIIERELAKSLTKT
ncbi:MAG TPA: TIR domain-containing protein [Pyrinomonadaceae bacterium]|jgi:hypothetical protein